MVLYIVLRYVACSPLVEIVSSKLDVVGFSQSPSFIENDKS